MDELPDEIVDQGGARHDRLGDSPLYLRAVSTAMENRLTIERAEFFSRHAEGVWVGRNSAMPNVRIEGKGNLVLVGSRSHVSKANIVVSGDGNVVVLGALSRIAGGRIHVVGDGSTFWFGSQGSADDMTVLVRENQEVVIGDDCLFSTRIIMETTDHHPIFDRGTGARVNLPGAIKIGAHVWVGREARIGKGAVIGAGSIIGQGAMVSGARCAETNSLYAGTPAKQIRGNVEWAHQKAPTLRQYEESDYAARRAAQAEWLRERRVG